MRRIPDDLALPSYLRFREPPREFFLIFRKRIPDQYWVLFDPRERMWKIFSKHRITGKWQSGFTVGPECVNVDKVVQKFLRILNVRRNIEREIDAYNRAKTEKEREEKEMIIEDLIKEYEWMTRRFLIE